MKRIIAALFFGTLATPIYGQDLAEIGPNTDEHPFQCGAAFAIMARVYKEAGNAERSAHYQTKFDKLAGQAEDIYARANRSKGGAQAYMQKHVDGMVSVAEKDAKLVINFGRVCDRRYPS